MLNRRLVLKASLVGLAVLAAASMSSPAYAEETKCRGTFGAVTVDNLRVPQGATCRLNGTIVKGTIRVKGNATLIASGVRVVGNVQAESATKVVVRDSSRVGGSVQVKQGGTAKVISSRIRGDIQYDANARN